MIITGSFAILLGSMLYCLIGAYGVILVAGVFLAIGLVGVGIVDHLRQAAPRAVLLREPEPVGRIPHGV